MADLQGAVEADVVLHEAIVALAVPSEDTLQQVKKLVDLPLKGLEGMSKP